MDKFKLPASRDYNEVKEASVVLTPEHVFRFCLTTFFIHHELFQYDFQGCTLETTDGPGNSWRKVITKSDNADSFLDAFMKTMYAYHIVKMGQYNETVTPDVFDELMNTCWIQKKMDAVNKALADSKHVVETFDSAKRRCHMYVDVYNECIAQSSVGDYVDTVLSRPMITSIFFELKKRMNSATTLTLAEMCSILKMTGFLFDIAKTKYAVMSFKGQSVIDAVRAVMGGPRGRSKSPAPKKTQVEIRAPDIGTIERCKELFRKEAKKWIKDNGALASDEEIKQIYIWFAIFCCFYVVQVGCFTAIHSLQRSFTPLHVSTFVGMIQSTGFIKNMIWPKKEIPPPPPESSSEEEEDEDEDGVPAEIKSKSTKKKKPKKKKKKKVVKVVPPEKDWMEWAFDILKQVMEQKVKLAVGSGIIATVAAVTAVAAEMTAIEAVRNGWTSVNGIVDTAAAYFGEAMSHALNIVLLKPSTESFRYILLPILAFQVGEPALKYYLDHPNKQPSGYYFFRLACVIAFLFVSYQSNESIMLKGAQSYGICTPEGECMLILAGGKRAYEPGRSPRKTLDTTEIAVPGYDSFRLPVACGVTSYMEKVTDTNGTVYYPIYFFPGRDPGDVRRCLGNCLDPRQGVIYVLSSTQPRQPQSWEGGYAYGLPSKDAIVSLFEKIETLQVKDHPAIGIYETLSIHERIPFVMHLALNQPVSFFRRFKFVGIRDIQKTPKIVEDAKNGDSLPFKKLERTFSKLYTDPPKKIGTGFSYHTPNSTLVNMLAVIDQNLSTRPTVDEIIKSVQ